MVLRAPYQADPDVAARSAVGGPFAREPRLARVEAVLFLAREPITTRKISAIANLADGTEARTLIRRLNDFYDAQGSAFRVEEVAGGFQLLSRRKFAGWLRRLVRTHVETRLSGPALETLAVAAYRQPVTRAEIEAIRGVACDEMLRQLMERDLLKIVGRSDELGRPFLYGTKRRFLQFFGLRHLDELPRVATLRADRAATTAAAADAADTEHAELPTDNDSQEERAVKIAADTDLAREEDLKRRRLARTDEVRAEDEDDDFEEDEDEDDDDDEDDDEEEEEDEEFDDDDFDDDWEEVDDEDDEDEDDEEEEDWDDDEEDDEEWDDDDEDEEEEEEDDEE
jgi:segregation and condensation protein B